MRRATVITLGVAALFATGAILFGRSWLDQQNASARSPGMSTIVVTARALKFGDAIGAADIRQVRWPAESVPAGAFHSVADLRLGLEQRQALQDIAANEPLIASRITGSGQRAILSAVVSPGMRAFAIRVDDVVGVAGFVLPNDRVDIILVRSEDSNRYNNNNAFRSDLLLQNVRVLGIDQEANTQENTPRIARAVTLEVSPEQAQILSLAAQAGSLRLALRNQAGSEVQNTRTITVQDLRNTSETTTPTAQHFQRRAPRAEAGEAVVVIRGDDRAVTHVSQ
ncbi:MAG: Flp pilus assembly protein CpaB [Proteobacteria bacterium]|nr:Flp pilus assembly protein CpaB [Pseudomonadota bacterium]